MLSNFNIVYGSLILTNIQTEFYDYQEYMDCYKEIIRLTIPHPMVEGIKNNFPISIHITTINLSTYLQVLPKIGIGFGPGICS